MKIEQVGTGYSTKAIVTKEKTVAITTNKNKNEVKDKVKNDAKPSISSWGNSDKWKVVELATQIITRHEWLHLRAYSDHKQCSIWYWTRAKSCGEMITKEEAIKRFEDALAGRVNKIMNDYPTLQAHQQASLVSLYYNCPSGYNRLGNNITESKFKSCVTAGGKVLNGLVKRRNNERALYTLWVIY